MFSHASHRSYRALARYKELDFVPVYTPSCSSHFSSVEHLWSALKLYVVRYLGQLSLRKRKLTQEDLTAIIDIAFENISIEARWNLCFSNRSEIFSILNK